MHRASTLSYHLSARSCTSLHFVTNKASSSLCPLFGRPLGSLNQSLWRSYSASGNSKKKPERDSKYAQLEERDIHFFNSVLQKDGAKSSLITDADTLATMNEDWMHQYKGNSRYLLEMQTHIVSFPICFAD